MSRKFALAALAAVLISGMCLAAGTASITSSAPRKGKTWNTKPSLPPAQQPMGSKATILFQDFEAGNGGFTMVSGNGSPADDWNWTSAAAPYATGNPNGANWWMLDADAYSGVNDEYLYSPVIDCGSYNNIQLAWFGCHRFYGSSYYFDVSISTDGGAGWTSIYNSTSDVSPSAAYGPVSVTAFAGQSNCQIRFHYYDDSWGYGAGVDDVLLTGDYQSFSHDLQTQSIDTPATVIVQPGVPFHGVWTVKNNGTSPESDFWTWYIVRDSLGTLVYNPGYNFVTPDSLAAGATRQIIAPTDFTPDTLMRYSVTAYTMLAGDEAPLNDTLKFNFRTYDRDAGATAILSPGALVTPDATVAPIATFHNFATEAASFDAYFLIDFGGPVYYEMIVPLIQGK